MLNNENVNNELATDLIINLGGIFNIIEVDSCMTRLRISLKDSSMVEKNKIKEKTKEILVSSNSIQIILGTNASIVADKMKKILGKKGINY